MHLVMIDLRFDDDNGAIPMVLEVGVAERRAEAAAAAAADVEVEEEDAADAADADNVSQSQRSQIASLLGSQASANAVEQAARA